MFYNGLQSMLFTSPIWLLGLLPWAAVVIYMFIGKRQGEMVPFLQLWEGPMGKTKPKRSVRWPPWFIVWLILSMLLAILAAAGPARWSGLSNGKITTIILDRGITMSPLSGDGKPFRGVLAIAGPFAGPIDLIDVPGESIRCTGADWVQVAQRMSPTAVDTQAAIEEAVAAKLRNRSGAVIVLTDRFLNQTDDGLIQIAPEGAVEDVGIAHLAARSESQVMVRLRNQSKRDSVPMRITSGGQTMSQIVKLPPAGGTKDVFVDMPKALGETIEVEIEPQDDANVNDQDNGSFVRNRRR